jgi:putative Mg2+ transporter-C (MgtC) family protein
VVCGATDEANIRALVAQSFASEQFILRAVHSENLDPGTGLVQVEAKVRRFGRDDIGLEAAVSRLSLEPAVSSVSWTVVETTAQPLAAG